MEPNNSDAIERLTICVPSATAERLRAEAARQDRSVSSMVRRCLDAALSPGQEAART